MYTRNIDIYDNICNAKFSFSGLQRALIGFSIPSEEILKIVYHAGVNFKVHVLICMFSASVLLVSAIIFLFVADRRKMARRDLSTNCRFFG